MWTCEGRVKDTGSAVHTEQTFPGLNSYIVGGRNFEAGGEGRLIRCLLIPQYCDVPELLVDKILVLQFVCDYFIIFRSLYNPVLYNSLSWIWGIHDGCEANSNTVGKGKGKVIPVQAVEVLRIARSWVSHVFRHSADRWRQGCQSYTPASLYPPPPQ
jgi:hypothetical protein